MLIDYGSGFIQERAKPYKTLYSELNKTLYSELNKTYYCRGYKKAQWISNNKGKQILRNIKLQGQWRVRT